MISVEELFKLAVFAGTIIGVFFNLNNKQIRNDERIKNLEKQLDAADIKASIASGIIDKNYEKFTSQLQTIATAVTKIEVVLEKFTKD